MTTAHCRRCEANGVESKGEHLHTYRFPTLTARRWVCRVCNHRWTTEERVRERKTGAYAGTHLESELKLLID